MTKTLTNLMHLMHRILGCPNPYAGYVEACADTVDYYKLGVGYGSARYLRMSYSSDKFTAQVQSRLMGVR